jgi:riboflavin synthase
MFTGLIEELGRVSNLVRTGSGSRITVAAEVVTGDIESGDSIAVNGVCLTALDIETGSFSADISPETLDRTTLGRLRIGTAVNLERAVMPSTRLGGHIVQGHVDGRGIFTEARAEGEFWSIRITFPAEIRRYLVFKGSVAVEGVSLTIAAIADDHFDIAVIPKTWQKTNFSTLQSGDQVNIETDIIGKYVENLVRFTGSEK